MTTHTFYWHDNILKKENSNNSNIGVKVTYTLPITSKNNIDEADCTTVANMQPNVVKTYKPPNSTSFGPTNPSVNENPSINSGNCIGSVLLMLKDFKFTTYQNDSGPEYKVANIIKKSNNYKLLYKQFRANHKEKDATNLVRRETYDHIFSKFATISDQTISPPDFDHGLEEGLINYKLNKTIIEVKNSILDIIEEYENKKDGDFLANFYPQKNGAGHTCFFSIRGNKLYFYNPGSSFYEYEDALSFLIYVGKTMNKWYHRTENPLKTKNPFIIKLGEIPTT